MKSASTGNSNSNTIDSYFSYKKPEINQASLHLLTDLEKLIKMPLQDSHLEDLVPDLDQFLRSCSGAREYLNRLRLECRDTKDQQSKNEVQLVLVCKHLLKILPVFLEESLGKILIDWERTLGKGNGGSVRLDNARLLVQITSVGLEMTFTSVTMVCSAVGKKQRIEEEIGFLVNSFKKFSETVISKPSLMMLGEYQVIVGEGEAKGEGGKVIQTIERVYKEIWKLIFMMKKTNQFGNQADSLLNLLEIALMQLFDSKETSHNVLGYELAMTIFTLTDDKYYLSLVSVVSMWNKSYPLHNIGKLFQIIFLYGNESVKERIISEVEKLEPVEMLNFVELFDTKMYEGFMERKLLFHEGSTGIPSPEVLEQKMGLSKNLVSKLLYIFNGKVQEDLMRSQEVLKVQGIGQDSPEKRKFIVLLKIASIVVGSPVFVKDGGATKLFDALLQLLDDYLGNPKSCVGTHYMQIQAIIDVAQKFELNATMFEQIVDITAKSEDLECQMFASKFGTLMQEVTHAGNSQKIILEKVGSIYHSMLETDDFMLKFKAVEGIMLTASNPTFEQEDLAVIVPPLDKDKELLRRVADPSQEAARRLNSSLNKEIIEIMGGRLPLVHEGSNQSKEKFNRIKKDYPYEIGGVGGEKDEEVDKACRVLEDAIKEMKEGNQNARQECMRLELRNKVNNLLNMLQG